jgi:prepilin-type N-terminal cleavage/methylation domain-containing protein
MILNSKGVTLIELVMVIAIVGILVSVSSMYIVEVVNMWNFFSFRSEIVSEARLALFRMVREIRQIGNVTDVYKAQISDFQFRDINSDVIEYSLSGGNLFRNSDVLAAGVTNLTFIYYNRTDGQIALPLVSPAGTDIFRIHVNMEIGAGSQTKKISSQAYPRNFAK